ncbi:MAG: hypothetical protein ACKO46_03850, partial [Alphaproteobacteria bacterium]
MTKEVHTYDPRYKVQWVYEGDIPKLAYILNNGECFLVENLDDYNLKHLNSNGKLLTEVEPLRSQPTQSQTFYQSVKPPMQTFQPTPQNPQTPQQQPLPTQPTQPQQRTPQQPIQQQGQQHQSPPSNRSEEFNKLFYKASSVDEYHDSYFKLQNGRNQDPKKFIESNFSLNGSAVNSVTFFEKAQVESRKSGYLWGTRIQSENEGKKEVVLIGQDARNAQNNMFKEYLDNAKQILELEAKYGATNLPDDLKELFAINANKDFNFLVKDANGTNTVNSPLVQRLDEIKKIGSANLLQVTLDQEQSAEIEKKANAYAKDLLVAQVKNNCLYTGDGTTNNPYKEAKRINIFRGKKDFKNKGISVIEVKFGNSCEIDDFALIPVGDKNLNLFCKVSNREQGEVELQYFKKDNNE